MHSFLALSAIAAASASAGFVPRDDGSSSSGGTINSNLICTGCQQTGVGNVNGSEAGEVPSLTSNENFINFCGGQDGGPSDKPVTNGVQITSGSCNVVPMGVIAATTNMPSSKFQFPKNLDNIKSNTNFTIEMAIQHLTTGNFVNADTNYYSAPCFTDGNGDIVGHSHVVVSPIDSVTSTTVQDPTDFVFFKGLNEAANNGIMTVIVENGLPAGSYKLGSINTCANHQPALVAVAQHAQLDDTVYFTVSDDSDLTNGVADGADVAGTATNESAAPAAAAATTTAAASTSTSGSTSSDGQSSSDGQDGNDGQNDSQDDGQDHGGFGGFDGHRVRSLATRRPLAGKRMARLSKRRLDLERSA